MEILTVLFSLLSCYFCFRFQYSSQHSFSSTVNLWFFNFEFRHSVVLSCNYYLNKKSTQQSICRLLQSVSTFKHFKGRHETKIFVIKYKKRLDHLVEALRYKPGGRGLDSRWGYWDFSLAYSLRPRYGPGFDSASNRNKKGKVTPVQVWTEPQGSRRLRLPDFQIIGTWKWQGFSPKHQPPSPPGNIRWYSIVLKVESKSES